jgi:hypothetical protein
VGAFFFWAARRLVVLVSHGLGITSTIASLVLLVVPTFSPGWSRWWAIAPVLGYVVVALLWEDYQRAMGGRLTAVLVEEKDDKYTRSFLEISNCGSVGLRAVEWELLGEPRGWSLLDEGIQRPLPELQPDEKLRLPLVLSMGSDAQATLRLRGVGEAGEYQRDKLVTVYG